MMDKRQSQPSRFNAVRLGEVRKILSRRCGHTLPDDDAGREYLKELLLPVSLGTNNQRRMQNQVEVWAPWMAADEAADLIEQITATPWKERMVDPRELGERLRLTYAERAAWGIKTIKPFDVGDQELKEIKRAKDRERKQRQRRAKGTKPRVLLNKPWIAEKMSRPTWFRRRRKTEQKAEQAA